MTPSYNGVYDKGRNERIVYPLGGIGAGMLGLEGTGALSHFSLRHTPDLANEPMVFAAICVKGSEDNVARVLEGPVPRWKILGKTAPGFAGAGCGHGGKTYGLPRFAASSFRARFPFATVELDDPRVPVKASIEGWSPFVPNAEDDSGMPVAALEYTLENVTEQPVELIFSFNAANFMSANTGSHATLPVPGGFVLHQPAVADRPWEEAAFCVRTDDPDVRVDHAWFRGGWYDPLTMIWKAIASGDAAGKPPVTDEPPSPGASLFVPVTLQPRERRTIRLQLSWYVPRSNVRAPEDAAVDGASYKVEDYHIPWYASRFRDIFDVSDHWLGDYGRLREASCLFSDTIYGTTMPPELTEAVTANLCILKSPTVLRQFDGRMWAWEGSFDLGGSCHGTCTHVWNYAQAIAHLFPGLERGLRSTELMDGQDDTGRQNFRVPLPIAPAKQDFHAASDGQLGGVMKVYREWRISGDTAWMLAQWPKVKTSLAFCMEEWDPERTGLLVEPHHNTYDIEFWGPDGMCSSVYAGALLAASRMAEAAGEPDAAMRYEALYRTSKSRMETELFNGEYFFQQVIWEGLRAQVPTAGHAHWNVNYSTEAITLLEQEGPKYQYGTGCLSDGLFGAWLADMCGLGDILDRERVRSHLLSVYKYNLKKDLSEHANPQRPGYALGSDGGLLLCTWPKGGQLSLPFVYSNEVWTGIEYEVASHLMAIGCVEEGLDIVRTCRDRYDGSARNPFDEYECGHWYARALASFGLIQAWSGIRYDACDRTLYIDPRVEGDYRSFLCTVEGYGFAGVREGKPFLDVVSGRIDAARIVYSAG